MLSFKTFIESQMQTPNKMGQTPIYQTAAYNAGITQGKKRERSILRSLTTSCGWSLEVPDDWRQDAFNAVDAVMVSSDGRRTPVQIKARKQGVGDDIGYEVAKNYQANDPSNPPSPAQLLRTLNGRDMRGIAKLTAVLAQTGDKITIIDTNEGHKMIEAAVADWLAVLERFAQMPQMVAKYQQGYTANGVQFVYKYDQRDHYWKIVAYIKPEAFKSKEVCSLRNRISTQFS
jgi:hypothetical protein